MVISTPLNIDNFTQKETNLNVTLGKASKHYLLGKDVLKMRDSDFHGKYKAIEHNNMGIL